jgi:hypothetical protein
MSRYPPGLNLIERMEARKEKGFRVSPQTGALSIDALRLYAHACLSVRYTVEKWNWNDAHVEEIVASASLVMVGRAAFHAPVDG